MKNQAKGKGRELGRQRVGLTMLALLWPACGVTNPGNILDADINDPQYMEGLLNGSKFRYANALCGGGSSVAFIGGNLFGDGFPSTTFTEERRAVRGDLPDSRPEWSNDLDELHLARWLAEETVRRMKEVMGQEYDSSPMGAEANIWAGLSNRLLGDTFCHAVIDGSPLQDRIEHYRRAEEQFTEALRIAEAVEDDDDADFLSLAAHGGRASVRIVLDDWTAALADAGEVPDDFEFEVAYSGTTGDNRTNTIHFQNWDRKDLTMKLTWFEDYYVSSGGQPSLPDDPQGDPRVAVKERQSKKGDVVKGSDQLGTPLLRQMKYTSGNDDVAAITGTEMRLIEIEHAIRFGNDWSAGRDSLNALRAAVDATPPLTAWVAASRQEAFEALVRERAIVLWNEGRRGGDIYRWIEDGAYAGPEDDEIISTMVLNAEAFGHTGFEPLAQRATCFRISETVRATNPNVE